MMTRWVEKKNAHVLPVVGFGLLVACGDDRNDLATPVDRAELQRYLDDCSVWRALEGRRSS